MGLRLSRDESSSPPARHLFLSSVVFGLAAAAVFVRLRVMFGGRPYIGPRRMYVGPFLEFVTLLCVAAGLAAAALGIMVATRPSRLGRRVRATARALGTVATVTIATVDLGLRWVETRLPDASAQSLALFRIVFGTLLLWFFLAYPVGAGMVPLAIPESAAHRAALPLFTAYPSAVDWIRPWLVFWALAFIAGAMTRISFAMLTAGAVAWALLWTMRVSAHSTNVLMLALLCLLPARWGDAWSIDALLRRVRRSLRSDDHPSTSARGAPSSVEGRRHPPYVLSRVYGYPMWILGIILGTAFGAAAFAKLHESGLAWITNGTVRFHFLTDSEQAVADWGVRLARNESVAVFMSLAAVALEALVIVGACSTRYRNRLAAGLAALALLVGFRLFQGLFWPAWWLLLVAFLPWHRIRSGSSAPEARPRQSRRALAPYIAMVILLVGQQVVASLATIEHAPFVSAFDMYSTTYSGPAEYEQKAGSTYWVVGELADDTLEPCKVTREEASAVAQQESGMGDTLAKCFQTRMPLVRRVTVESRRRAIDWVRWRLGDEVRTPIAGPIVLR